MFTQLSEQQFFFEEINHKTKVLEYGSGESTLEIAKACKEIVSVEHQRHWYTRLNNIRPVNCTLLYCPPDLPYREGGDCGTYEEFKTYINSPVDYAPFDVILIDGRARVSCASVCDKLAHSNTLIFVHDFDRKEYQEILKKLTFVSQIGTMAKFKI